jgi:tetratricopeptide (TPR) repeat protein
LSETDSINPSVMFLDASIDEGTKHFEQALSKLDAIPERNPAVLTEPYYDDLRVWIPAMRGITLTELKRFSEARPLLEEAVSKAYLKERTLFYLGACCYELKDFTEAQRYLSESLAVDMTTDYKAMARFFLAMTYLSQRQFAAARQEFEWCFRHQDQAAMRHDHLIGGLVRALEGLGLRDEAKRYSDMLRVQ